MNFEDLKVIWDSQADAPMYAVNEEGLHALLRQNTAHFTRRMRWQRLQTYLASLMVVGPISFLLVAHFGGLNPLATTWDAVALFTAAAAWLYFGGRVFVGRKRQAERERHFTSSLRDEIDRDIAQVTYQPGFPICLPQMAPLIHPRAAERTKFCSAYNRPAPEAVTSAHADVEPTGAAAFRAFLRHRSTLVPFLRQPSLHSAARQPAGTGSAQILRSISPKSRRFR